MLSLNPWGVPKSTVIGTIGQLRFFASTPTIGLVQVTIYTRVSSRDKQDPENQLRQLREFCAKQGWNIVQEYEDRASGDACEQRQVSANVRRRIPSPT
jgi:hypothetical protein